MSFENFDTFTYCFSTTKYPLTLPDKTDSNIYAFFAKIQSDIISLTFYFHSIFFASNKSLFVVFILFILQLFMHIFHENLCSNLPCTVTFRLLRYTIFYYSVLYLASCTFVWPSKYTHHVISTQFETFLLKLSRF